MKSTKLQQTHVATDLQNNRRYLEGVTKERITHSFSRQSLGESEGRSSTDSEPRETDFGRRWHYPAHQAGEISCPSLTILLYLGEYPHIRADEIVDAVLKLTIHQHRSNQRVSQIIPLLTETNTLISTDRPSARRPGYYSTPTTEAPSNEPTYSARGSKKIPSRCNFQRMARSQYGYRRHLEVGEVKGVSDETMRKMINTHRDSNPNVQHYRRTHLLRTTTASVAKIKYVWGPDDVKAWPKILEQ
jgi:hypothetical protein